MASKVIWKKRLEFREQALEELYKAYNALVKGGVKSYTIDDRMLTKFDLPDLREEITEMEAAVDEAQAYVDGKNARKAVGVIPRDW